MMRTGVYMYIHKHRLCVRACVYDSMYNNTYDNNYMILIDITCVYTH